MQVEIDPMNRKIADYIEVDRKKMISCGNCLVPLSTQLGQGIGLAHLL